MHIKSLKMHIKKLTSPYTAALPVSIYQPVKNKVFKPRPKLLCNQNKSFQFNPINTNSNEKLHKQLMNKPVSPSCGQHSTNLIHAEQNMHSTAS